MKSLSDLPENAIDEILCRLPISEAVRTSILSRYWRHRWKSIPQLNLSELTFPEMNNILDQHRGPLSLFKAKQPFSYVEDDNWSSNSWLASLRRHSASTLRTLSLRFTNVLDINFISYHFPNLTHLKIKDCSLNLKQPPKFIGFASIRLFSLSDTNIDGGKLSRVISSCPLLEKLRLRNVNVKRWLRIVAPNLRCFELVDVGIDDLSQLTMMAAPLLEVATFCTSVRDDDDSDDYEDGGSGIDYEDGDSGKDSAGNLTKVIWSMRSIQNLWLNHRIFKYLSREAIPQRLLTTNFDHLKVMSLEANLGDMKEVLLALRLLRSTPHLQKLKITDKKYLHKVLETRKDFWDAQEHIDVFAKLETVKLTQSLREEDDISFIQLLLAKAQMLETVKISIDLCDENVNADDTDGSDNDGGNTINNSDCENCNLIEVFQHIASIKYVKLCRGTVTFLGRGHIPERIYVSFECLSLLSLDLDLGDKKEVLVTLCLLRSAPNLQNLVIRIRSSAYNLTKIGNDFWEAQKHTNLVDKLGTLTISPVSYNEDELAFIQLLLAKAPVLKTTMINLRSSRNKELLIIRLLGFSRVSSEARILLTR